MRNRVYKLALGMVTLFVLLSPMAAQVEVGENVSLNLGGSLSTGYGGTFSDDQGSTHGLDFGGYGNLNGSYYNPKFLSFTFQPYYRRSQSNSIYQSVTNGSGFTGTTNIFSGSRFPGSIAFSRTYDETGQFGLPGISGITSHGNGQNFAISWSALLPDKPTLTASFSTSGGTSSVFGSEAESESHSRNFTLQSTYDLAGFQLMGQYSRLSSDASFPELVESSVVQDATNTSNILLVTAGHKLPLLGHWFVTWNRSSYGGELRGGTETATNNGTVNDVNTTVSLNPTRKLGLAFGADYNDNFYGTLQRQLMEVGGASLVPVSSSSNTFSTYAQGSYSVFSHLSVYGRVSHHELALSQGTRGVNQFSGSANFNYAQRLLGALTFSIGVVDTATEQGNSGAALVGNASYLRRFSGWEVEGNFGYSQQVQTLFDVYTTSMYRYGGRAKRRFGSLHWTAGFTGSHSGLAHYEGFNSRHESFNTSLQYDRYGVNGQYSQSSGASILTPGGLVEIPEGLPAPLVQQSILYDGKSYGGGVSYRPFRRCILTGNYNKAYSNTIGAMYSGFSSTIANARLQYRFRKLDVDFNYTRFQQDVTTGNLPAVLNSYYFRMTRSFNIF